MEKIRDRLWIWGHEAGSHDTHWNTPRPSRMTPAEGAFCGKILGCYMWDYGRKQPMPLERMQYQCETGLRWLQEGRIEGMIFLASCICDLELETVEWTRRWIAAVGDEPV